MLNTISAAAWGFSSCFALCVLLVVTKRWHGALTMDFTDGIQKFHTAPTPRIGGIPIVLGLVLAWSVAEQDLKDLLLPIVLAGMPAFLFGLAEDLTKRVGVMQRLLATMASGLLAWWITEVLFSIYRRKVRKDHPGMPDRLHFHSLVRRRYVGRWFGNYSNVTRNSITGVLVGLLTFTAIILACLTYASSALSALAFLNLGLGYVSFYARMVRHHWCSPLEFLLIKPNTQTRALV